MDHRQFDQGHRSGYGANALQSLTQVSDAAKKSLIIVQLTVDAAYLGAK